MIQSLGLEEEEFAIIQPNTKPVASLASGNRIKKQLNTGKILNELIQKYPATPSVGKVSMTIRIGEYKGAESPEDFFRRVDHALVEAKAKDDRDTVMFA